MSSVVDEYLSQVDAALPMSHPMRRRIVREVESYLSDDLERHAAEGAVTVRTTTDALARFGAPQDVALAFAEARGFRASPTVITRLGGLAGIIASILIWVAVTVQTTLSWSLVWPDRLAIVGGVAVGIATGALHLRQRGLYRGIERWGFHLLVSGVAAVWVSAVTWSPAGGTIAFMLLGAGFVTMGSASYRACIAPRLPVLLLTTGSTIAIPLNGLHEMATPLGAPSTAKEVLILCSLLAIAAGWLWIGAILWRERLPRDATSSRPALRQTAIALRG